MNCAHWEERLNDYVDGSIGTEESLGVERHLETCPGCRDEADGLRSLLAQTAALPRRIEPARDLWPGIVPGLRRTGQRWPGMAAAVFILAAAAAASTLWQPASTRPAAPAATVVGAGLDETTELRSAASEFRIATEKLMAVLERRKADLPPRAVAELEDNLRVVNTAIAEIGAALARDPDNPRLERLLTDVYATKVDLLTRAVRVPGAA